MFGGITSGSSTLEPFLLIARTARIVTAVDINGE